MGDSKAMTENDVAKEIASSTTCLGMRYRDNVFVLQNVSWGFFHWGECDYLVCRRNGKLIDVEIKTTISDLRKDFGKAKWNGKAYLYERSIYMHYYALPVDIFDAAKPIIEESRIDSGIVVIDTSKRYRGGACRVAKLAKANDESKALDHTRIVNLARLGMFRYWRSYENV